MTIQKTTSAIIVAAAMGISAFAASVQAEAGNPLCTGYSKSCVYLDAGYNGLFGTKNGRVWTQQHLDHQQR